MNTIGHNIIKNVRKYLAVSLLLIFSTSNIQAADTVSNWDQVSALVEEYSWVGTAAGVGISYISAKKHDAMLASYFAKVLQALDAINTKLDILRATTCNIYQHQTNQDYATFQRQLTDYLQSADRNVFYADLHNLQYDATAIIAALEDHANLLSDCALDQYEFLAIYMTMANIDLSIQAEYIRRTYYIAYRMQANGSLIPLDQMDPQTRATMESLISTDIKTKLALRMGRIIHHLKVLDSVDENGIATPFSWRARSDKRFSSLTGSEDIYRTVGRGASVKTIRWIKRYTFNGQYYQYAWYDTDFAPLYGICCESTGRITRRLPRFSLGNNLWVTIPNSGRSPDECIYRKQTFFRTTRVIAPTSGACQHYTRNPTLTSIFDNYNPQIFQGDFAYLNTLNTLSYLLTTLSSGSIYYHHKADKYRELVNSDLAPMLALVEQWRNEVNQIDAPSVADVPPIPSFIAVQETR